MENTKLRNELSAKTDQFSNLISNQNIELERSN